MLTDKQLARFNKKIAKQPNGCWLWTGHIEPAGYGIFTVQTGQPVRVHRVAYEIANGPIPKKPARLCVCHRCDVRHCVNPEHLFLGTDQDNAEDMRRKGRAQRGEKHYRAKLTEAQVRELRLDPRPARHWASVYGVSSALICWARLPGSWPSVPFEGLTTQERRAWRKQHRVLKPPKPRAKRPPRVLKTVPPLDKRGRKRLLTPAQVEIIKGDMRAVVLIAADYGVSTAVIYAALSGRYPVS